MLIVGGEINGRIDRRREAGIVEQVTKEDQMRYLRQAFGRFVDVTVDFDSPLPQRRITFSWIGSVTDSVAEMEELAECLNNAIAYAKKQSEVIANVK